MMQKNILKCTYVFRENCTFYLACFNQSLDSFQLDESTCNKIEILINIIQQINEQLKVYEKEISEYLDRRSATSQKKHDCENFVQKMNIMNKRDQEKIKDLLELFQRLNKNQESKLSVIFQKINEERKLFNSMFDSQYEKFEQIFQFFNNKFSQKKNNLTYDQFFLSFKKNEFIKKITNFQDFIQSFYTSIQNSIQIFLKFSFNWKKLNLNDFSFFKTPLQIEEPTPKFNDFSSNYEQILQRNDLIQKSLNQHLQEMKDSKKDQSQNPLQKSFNQNKDHDLTLDIQQSNEPKRELKKVLGTSSSRHFDVMELNRKNSKKQEQQTKNRIKSARPQSSRIQYGNFTYMTTQHNCSRINLISKRDGLQSAKEQRQIQEKFKQDYITQKEANEQPSQDPILFINTRLDDYEKLIWDQTKLRRKKLQNYSKKQYQINKQKILNNNVEDPTEYYRRLAEKEEMKRKTDRLLNGDKPENQINWDLIYSYKVNLQDKAETLKKSGVKKAFDKFRKTKSEMGKSTLQAPSSRKTPKRAKTKMDKESEIEDLNSYAYLKSKYLKKQPKKKISQFENIEPQPRISLGNVNQSWSVKSSKSMENSQMTVEKPEENKDEKLEPQPTQNPSNIQQKKKASLTIRNFENQRFQQDVEGNKYHTQKAQKYLKFNRDENIITFIEQHTQISEIYKKNSETMKNIVKNKIQKKLQQQFINSANKLLILNY